MATPVPYTGAPQENVALEPTPDVRVQGSPAAFGANIAEAASHLGQIQEGAGKELFDRAIAMQELDQHAAANSAIADYQNKALNSYLDFTQKEGKNAVDAYPEYQQNLDKMREDIGSNMPSPYAKFLFDQESRQSRFRMAWYGGAYAKGEQKRYVIGSAQAAIDSDKNMMELTPGDAQGNVGKIQDIRDHINHLADIGGVSPEKRKDMVDSGVSEAVLGQIRGMARKDPTGAQKLLDEAIGNKTIMGPDVERVGDYVRAQSLNIGSRHSAAQTMTGSHLEFGAGIVEPIRAQGGIKAIEGGNYSTRGPTVTDKSGHSGHGLGAYQVMSYNLQGWLREAGMPAMPEQAFLSSRDAQDSLFNFKFGQYMKKYGSFNKAAMAWLGGEGSVNKNPGDVNDGFTSGTKYLSVANAALARSASLKEITDIGRRRADAEFPGDQEYSDAVTAKIETSYNNEMRITRDTEFRNEQTIWSALSQGQGPTKSIPTTVEELTADPAVKEAWDQLKPSEQYKYMNILARQAKGDVALTPERLRNYQTLHGEAYNDQDKFLKEDLIAADLPMKQKLELIKLRDSVYKRTYAPANTGHALSILGPQLNAIGLTKTKDPDNFNTFTGIIGDVMRQYQEDNHRPMKDDEILQAGSRLLQTKSGWFYSYPVFEDEVPPKEAEAIRNSPVWESRGITPTEMDIKRLYYAMHYQELFGKKVAK